MVLCQQKQKYCGPEELSIGDCWVALSLAKDSGLVLSGRIGKHTDELAQELIEIIEGKTACHHWQTDSWVGYSRQLPDEATAYLHSFGLLSSFGEV